jgi:hypothetical protein
MVLGPRVEQPDAELTPNTTIEMNIDRHHLLPAGVLDLSSSFI